MGLIADRVIELVIARDQLGGVGHELARNGVVRIGGIDQRGKSAGDRNAVLGADGIERVDVRIGGEACFGEVRAGA